MAFNNYLEEVSDKPYFTKNSLAYYYDKMEGFAKAVEGSAKALNLTKEEIEQRIALRLAEWDGKLEGFDSSVESLLTEWVDDGTLTPLIDSTLIDQKVAPLALQLEKTAEGLNLRLDEKIIESGAANAEVTDAHVSSVKNKTFSTISNRINEAEYDMKKLQSLQLRIDNAVKNTTFTTLDEWLLTNATATTSNGVATLTPTAAGVTRFLTVTKTRPLNGQKVYASVKVNIKSGVAKALRIWVRDWVTGSTFTDTLYVNFPSNNIDYDIDKIVPITTNFLGDLRLYVEVEFETGQAGTYTVTKPQILNLTTIFGLGKEPTKDGLKDILSKNANGFIADYILLDKSANETEVMTKSITETNRLLTNYKSKDIVKVGSYTSTKKMAWTISYDDESKTIYDHAFPIHQAENVPAIFYIVPDRIGTEKVFAYGKALSDTELQNMATSGLFEIGHHTVGHVQTTSLSASALRGNIESGLSIFKQKGLYPKHFSYPGGAMNASNRNVLRDYFVSAGATTYNANEPESYNMHPFAIDRRSCDSWFINFQSDLDKLIAKGEGWLISYMHAVHPDGQIQGIAQGTGDVITSTCWTPAQLQQMIQYAKSKGVEIVSMDEGLRTYAPFEYFYNEQVEPLHAVQRNGVVVNNPAT